LPSVWSSAPRLCQKRVANQKQIATGVVVIELHVPPPSTDSLLPAFATAVKATIGDSLRDLPSQQKHPSSRSPRYRF
jgi:hypothetical protein